MQQYLKHILTYTKTDYISKPFKPTNKPDMRYPTLIGTLLCLYGSGITAQTVDLNGPKVNIHEILLDNGLPLNNLPQVNPEGKPLYTPILVYKSKNNSFFAKVTNEAVEENGELKSLSLSDAPATGTFEMFDANGTLLYKAKTEWPISRCKILGDGKICGVTTSWSNEEAEWYSRVIFLNDKGAEIFRVDSIDNFYPNADGKIIYYSKTYATSNYLFCKNFIDGSAWKIPIHDNSRVGSVSGQGYHTVVTSSVHGLYSYGPNGELLWSNPNSLGGGGSLSFRGEFLLRGSNSADFGFNLYENKTGKYLFTIGSSVVDGIVSHAFRGCFIDGSADRIAILYNVKGRYALKLFNTLGEELHSQFVNSSAKAVNFFNCAYRPEGKVDVYINHLLADTINLPSAIADPFPLKSQEANR